MRKLIRIYRQMPFEQKTVWKTLSALCASAMLASGKLVVGLFTDYNLCGVAAYTFGILLAKLECILGIKTNKRPFKQRNFLTAAFLFASSAIYIGFMCRMFFIERRIRNDGMLPVLLLAFISFVELGFAIAGLIRTKNKGHYFRNLKIISFCMALIAILTTQMSLLDMNSPGSVVDMANAYTGIGVGILIALCAVYILSAPYTSVIGREHNVFRQEENGENVSIDTGRETLEMLLCRSKVHGSYVYRASVKEGVIEGDIEREVSLWKRMPVLWKILCCILSEILLFVWLASRFLFYLRSIDLPGRLERRMKNNGFVKVENQQRNDIAVYAKDKEN